MKAAVTFLRSIALAEAVSYLLLVGMAMPLKYLAGQPLAVRIVGMVHGLLFIALCWALLQTMLKAKWPVKRCALVMGLSFIPIVPFFFDKRMREWEREAC
jgi:integral membrane protein